MGVASAVPVAFLTLLGCRPAVPGGTAVPLVCPATSAGIAQVVEVLIDWSGSIRPAAPLDETLLDVSALVEELPGGTRFGVRWLTDASYDDRNRVVVGEIPSIPPEPERPLNPYDPEARKVYRVALAEREIALHCAEESRQWLLAEVGRLNGPGAPAMRTDLHGGLTRVSEVFAGYGSGTARRIIVYSDLNDDAGQPFAPADGGLAGAQAIVRTVRAGLGTAESRAIEASFDAMLSHYGAATLFIPLEAISWPVILAANPLHSHHAGS